MNTIDYTSKRALTLRKMSFSDTDIPNIKILWLDLLSSAEMNSRNSWIYHFHSFYEVHFNLSGTSLYSCDDTSVEIQPLEALFIPPCTNHRFISCSDGTVRFSLAFSLENSDGKMFLSEAKKVKRITLSDNIVQSINYILERSEKTDFLTPAVIKGRLLEIVGLLCEKADIQIPTYNCRNLDSRVYVAQKFINENLDRHISINDVAGECCLSSKQLGRLFKKYTGKSVFEYITYTRINRAKKLLASDRYTIKEVCYALGFESESGFAVFFKRHCGMTPGDFKKDKLNTDTEEINYELQGNNTQQLQGKAGSPRNICE
ncbi:MAG: helix-turn-helix domain-containing protein [Ruminococcaceae bacterium]|nr:helix-turn-helix domain-containing protein [Oscillospiraceae bacterium]